MPNLTGSTNVRAMHIRGSSTCVRTSTTYCASIRLKGTNLSIYILEMFAIAALFKTRPHAGLNWYALLQVLASLTDRAQAH
ncbi:MAG: hypothetical protein E5299_00802 [Burkholderia gladioli]|nr:MAG: hypothetical protein E5299_00802 [Burkholderia gladioli]